MSLRIPTIENLCGDSPNLQRSETSMVTPSLRYIIILKDGLMSLDFPDPDGIAPAFGLFPV